MTDLYVKDSNVLILGYNTRDGIKYEIAILTEVRTDSNGGFIIEIKETFNTVPPSIQKYIGFSFTRDATNRDAYVVLVAVEGTIRRYSRSND